MSTVVVTTSWDDGHKLDMRLARLLAKYNLRATFYVAPEDREFVSSDLLNEQEIKRLSQDFEIGAHTMTHPRLTQVQRGTARQEIVESKAWLENVIGKKVQCFCYPGGDYAPEHVTMVKDAGYTYARTVDRFALGIVDEPFEAATTLHAYRHWSDAGKILRFAGFNPVKALRYLLHWDELAKALFDRTVETGGVYHLWGHSWEIDFHDDWVKLESVLRYISGHANAQYVTNGELECRPKRNSLS